MDSLSFPFTIEIDGTPIAKFDDSGSPPIQAQLGPNAAVFTLKDSRLACDDWVLGRNKSEDRSLLPKKVLWFKADAGGDDRVQPVTARKDAEEYQIKFAGANLMTEDDKIFVELMGGE
ncbi:hypothetical protein BKA66DRAFT_432210 [Pyrenochaeta sp. MPI-SDFR-AT-0127]|nr:hypothetical protein BKA66DRAFT_432210 [Pyrenochaeta sp. MPI-SDFR-AT-0127]